MISSTPILHLEIAFSEFCNYLGRKVFLRKFRHATCEADLCFRQMQEICHLYIAVQNRKSRDFCITGSFSDEKVDSPA